MAFLLPQLVREVIGICYKIHEEGGFHLAEEQYIEALKSELELKGFTFRQNEVISLEYLGKVVDKHLIEFIIEDKILLDTKGRQLLRHPIFHKQMTAYLLKENLPLALVIDFHSRHLQIRRIINPNYNYQLKK